MLENVTESASARAVRWKPVLHVKENLKSQCGCKEKGQENVKVRLCRLGFSHLVEKPAGF